MASVTGKQKKIEHGSEEHANMLRPAYGVTLADAKTLIAERAKDFTSVPFVEFRRARAMISSLSSKPVVTSSHRRPLSHG